MSSFSFRLKRFCLVIVLLYVSLEGFAESLQVLKTRYFDIIYSPSSKVSATLLYEYADSYAEEIATRLGKKIPHRYPVYLSSKSEVLNGYYTLFPYQRIVIYDSTAKDGELGNSYDSILNVFYHELTHAISLWYYLPILSLSFDEGVAVLFESREDQGRLNDPLIMHHLMQNKIDKTTPTWREAAGHRDVYPAAFWAYIYGASFLSYLENIYGNTEYVKFFHSHFFVFPKAKTKHIFKKPLEELWKDFVDSISYPENILKPEVFAKEKMSDNVIASMPATQKIGGFACYDFSKKAVYFYDATGKKQKLFNAPSSITDLNFSPDASFLLVTDIKDDFGKIKQRLSIYDMNEKKFLKQHKASIRYASFAGEKKICAIKVEEQNSYLVLLDFELNEEEILFGERTWGENQIEKYKIPEKFQYTSLIPRAIPFIIFIKWYGDDGKLYRLWNNFNVAEVMDNFEKAFKGQENEVGNLIIEVNDTKTDANICLKVGEREVWICNIDLRINEIEEWQ